MNEIIKYFPKLSEKQIKQFEQLNELYRDWNEKINVISRKDIDNIYQHHVLHSLAIAKIINFKPKTRVLDIGTGGGFPGIPLAILFPETTFKLIDGTAKKILVANSVAHSIELNNVTAVQLRAENEIDKYDFVVSRAVMKLPDLTKLIKKNISKRQQNSIPNGLICLKGGNVDSEIQPYKKIVEIECISNYFEESWFEDKHIIYLPL